MNKKICILFIDAYLQQNEIFTKLNNLISTTEYGF